MILEQQVISSAMINLGLYIDQDFIPAWRNKPAVPFSMFLDKIWNQDNLETVSVELNRSHKTVRKYLRQLIPQVPALSGKRTWRYWLISQSDFRYCEACYQYKVKSDFTIDNSNQDGLNSSCSNCRKVDNEVFRQEINPEYSKLYYQNNKELYRYHDAKRRAAKLKATPQWADLEKIKKIYSECPEGYHVDHIIPLQGSSVCGLHVQNNLQYLTAADNLKKSNKLSE